jgi:hypothetical protein
MELSFTETEQIGRSSLANGDLEQVRVWFSLSYTRLAGHLQTNSRTLKRWLAEPDFALNIHSTTAARIGEFVSEMAVRSRLLLDEGVRIIDLYPLALLAGQMGKSVSSPTFTEMCRTKEITCYDMGVLGVYIPMVQVEVLKGKK